MIKQNEIAQSSSSGVFDERAFVHTEEAPGPDHEAGYPCFWNSITLDVSTCMHRIVL
jgi:hypothetical protein